MTLINHGELDGVTAILGGSFDPIHLGHLHIAKQIITRSLVAKVLFMPNGKHNFKQETVLLKFSDRLGLIKEAISSEPRFDVSTEDKGGTGFTSDLMLKLQRKKPDTRYVFVIGSDNLGTLQHWHNFAWLQKHTHFLILPRPGYQLDLEMVANIKASILQIELSPVSSSDIRAKIALGESIQGLVPENLEKRIVQLYTSTNLQP